MRISDWSSDVCSSDLFIVHGEAFRLEVVSGTVMSGPVHLTYLLAQDERLARQMDTIRRLEQGLADTEAGHVQGTSRMVRSALALRPQIGRESCGERGCP